MKNVARRYYINKVLKDKADYNYLNIFLPAKSTENFCFMCNCKPTFEQALGSLELFCGLVN